MSVPGPTTTRAGRVPLADQVVFDLRRLILAGEFPPGQPLREEHLAHLLGVSRGPVREALSELEREGLVERRPRRGAIVAQFGRRDLEEVYSLRRAQESVAVRFALRVASDLELAELRHRADMFGDACEKDASEETIASQDLDFHDHLYRIARHDRLYRTWLMLRTQVFMFLRWRSGVTVEMRRKANAGHLEIVAALLERDEPRALQAADNHLVEAYTRAISSLPDWVADERPPPLPSPPRVFGPDERGEA
jgi:DNA-binding GntR family transcriptional regulator